MFGSYFTQRFISFTESYIYTHHPLGPFDSHGVSSNHHTDQSIDYVTNTFCPRSVEWLEFDELDTY